MKKVDQEGKKFWDVPGGRIDGNEKVLDALTRELKEEIPSIKEFKIGRILSAYRLERDLKDGHGLCLLFYEVEAEPFEVELSDEHIGYKWFSLEELHSLNTKECYISPGCLDVAKKSLIN